jgi:hypothetical protein
MLDLQLPVLVEFDFGVLHFPLDLLLRFFFPKPFSGRRSLQYLVVAGADTVPKRLRIIELVLETRVSFDGEHRFGGFRRHRSVQHEPVKQVIILCFARCLKNVDRLNGFFVFERLRLRRSA